MDLSHDIAGKSLESKYQRVFEYSDCWVDDARLVVLNAVDTQDRGGVIHPRHKITNAVQENGLWQITFQNQRTGAETQYCARVLVNAAGPWASVVIQDVIETNVRDKVRLVRGSHIVVPKLFDHERAYFFQGKDGRIVFAIPYEDDFTVVDTTDCEHSDANEPPICNDAKKNYLCDFVSEYFERPVGIDDIVWSYSGVRVLMDDDDTSASAASREYVLKLDTSGGAPLLNVFGGKITTYRKPTDCGA